ncbi:MAG: hypothetical protein ACJ8DO_11510, partial [Microvirga sp.]|jgi:hypothetical protein
VRVLFAGIAILTMASAEAAVRCDGVGCGAELMTAGWMKIAECAGHNWSYLLEKDATVLICTGVNGRAGPIESPCQVFKGNLNQYRAMAARPERRGAECVVSSAAKGEFEK